MRRARSVSIFAGLHRSDSERAGSVVLPIGYREAAWAAAASLCFAAVFCYPAACQWVTLGPGWGWLLSPPDWSHFWRYPLNGDWDLFTHLRWVPYYTVAHFHQLPFWDPYR